MSDKQKLYFHKAEAKKVSRWWSNRKYCLNAVFLAIRMTEMKIGGEERLKSVNWLHHTVRKSKIITGPNRSPIL